MICDGSYAEVFRAFHELARGRFDTPLFHRWSGDKINSCHLYGSDGETCGLAQDWCHRGNQEIFSSKTILWFCSFFCTHLPSFICYHSLYVCVLAVCGRLPVFRCHVCCSSWCVCVRWRSGQTDLSRRDVWQDAAVNLILPELNVLRCYLRESDLGLRWKGLRLTEESNHTRWELMAGKGHTFVCVCEIWIHLSYCSKP